MKQKVTLETKRTLLELTEWLSKQIKSPANSDYNRGWNDVILDLKNKIADEMGIDNKSPDTPKVPPI
jgi:hypothetical protein